MKYRDKTQLNRSEKTVFVMLMFLLVITLILVFAFMYMKRLNGETAAGKKAYSDYKLHYMLITGEDSDFENDFYNGAREAGKENSILIEDLHRTLEESYSIREQMEIAIAAQVKGIILEADESEEIKELIDRASAVNIPVVTIWRDSYQSKRKCFIGSNNYQLGEIYGEQILKLAGSSETRVTVLLDYNEEAGPNMVYSGITDKVAGQVKVDTIFIDRSDNFSSEETIRSLAVSDKERPDILVCLNSTDTLCAALAAVDHNVVGQMQILGYYSSAETLEAIDKEIIAASVTVDTKKMGQKAVETLYTYRTNKYINEYETVEAQIITKENLEQFRANGGEPDE